MTQIWIYCSTRLPSERVANWKMKWLCFLVQKRDKKYKGYIFDWYVSDRNYQVGLRYLYRRSYQGKVDEIMLHSLNDTGNVNEQFDFIERMQELGIPAFSLKAKDYILTETK